MFRKSSTKKPSPPVLKSEQLQNLVVEVTEQNQANISGGSRFPSDGPGRGGTCDISGWWI
ncbi:hypothetical protein ACE1B6_26980 [Aerosakkonemataceae cyanobacterium BLCC-F154]|uniref:Uncharacterized protein n=1 Tax=Floridaenema fluviatile BLCC-F154 TaxID=3153640 RepID=A0ABV4YJ96_9CYAN